MKLLYKHGHTLISYLFYVNELKDRRGFGFIDSESVLSDNNISVLHSIPDCFDIAPYVRLLFSSNGPNNGGVLNDHNLTEFIKPNTITIGLLETDYDDHCFCVISTDTQCVVFNTYVNHGTSEFMHFSIEEFNNHLSLLRSGDDVYDRLTAMFGIEFAYSHGVKIVHYVDLEIISENPLTEYLVLKSIKRIRDLAMNNDSPWIDTSLDVSYLTNMIIDAIEL